jgi:hypothetical protein
VSGEAAPRRRRPGAHARRPRGAVTKRVARRLPSLGRSAAILLLAAFVAGLVAVVDGPWLRVSSIAVAGQRYTSAGQIADTTAGLEGQAVLMVDTAGLAERLRSLPAVADATVETVLPGEVRISVAEKEPAFLWLTSAGLLIGAADGSILAALPSDGDRPPELGDLPFVDDQRAASTSLTIGSTINAEELRIARRVLDLDPAIVGSEASRFAVRIADEYGFVLVSSQPPWRAALGVYGLDPAETPEAADARFEAQVSAIRTLFTTVREYGVTWVDVRNPGKVYWAP